jgi:hypothetical protein
MSNPTDAPDFVHNWVERLPKHVDEEITALGADARDLAVLIDEFVAKFERLRGHVWDLVWRGTELTDDGGDFQNKVVDESGLATPQRDPRHVGARN